MRRWTVIGKGARRTIQVFLAAAIVAALAIALPKTASFAPLVDALMPIPPSRDELRTIKGVPSFLEENAFPPSRFTPRGVALHFSLDGHRVMVNSHQPAFGVVRDAVRSGRPMSVRAVAAPSQRRIHPEEVFEIRGGDKVLVSYRRMVAHNRTYMRVHYEWWAHYIVGGSLVLFILAMVGLRRLFRSTGSVGPKSE